jgi:tetratricopeptide (TPR) repeat protein
MAAGDYAAAIAVFQDVTMAYPDHAADAYSALGLCYMKQGKLSEAITALQEGIASAVLPQDADVVKLMNQRIGDCYFSLNDYANAIIAYQALAIGYPDTAGYAVDMIGLCYTRQAKLSEAITASQEGIASAVLPQGADAVKRMKQRIADCYFGLDDHGNAIIAYHALAIGYPDTAGYAGYMIGLCYMRQAKLSEAITASQEGIASAVLPQDADVVKLMNQRIADCYFSLNDYANAIIAYQALAIGYPDTAGYAGYMIGLCYKAKGDGANAYAFLEGLDSTSPEQKADISFWSAELALRDGDYEKAARLYRQVASECPDYPMAKEAAVWSGVITLWNLWKPADARAIFTDLLAQVQTLGLDESELLYQLAYCSYVEKDYMTALTGFRSVCDAYPDSLRFMSALYMVGDCSVRVGDIVSAQNAFNKVIQDFPDNELAGSAQERLAVLISIKKPESKPAAKSADTKVACLEKKEGHIDEAK